MSGSAAASTLRVRLDANDSRSNLDIHKVITNLSATTMYLRVRSWDRFKPGEMRQEWDFSRYVWDTRARQRCWDQSRPARDRLHRLQPAHGGPVGVPPRNPPRSEIGRMQSPANLVRAYRSSGALPSLRVFPSNGRGQR